MESLQGLIDPALLARLEAWLSTPGQAALAAGLAMLLLGLLIALLALRRLRRELAGLQAHTTATETRAARAEVLAERAVEVEARLAETTDLLVAEKARTATLQGTLEAERAAHHARLEELHAMKAEIERSFGALAQKALTGNSEEFLKRVTERFEKHQATANADLSRRQEAIANLLKPVGENLEKFERRVGEIEKAREGAYQAIQTQVRSLAEGQMQLRGETGKLVQALRAPKTRGRWGEFQLRQVFEMAGMVEHVDFLTEQQVEIAGAKLRPDAIIRLPGGKCVVVDAKTPLDAYLNATEAEDEATREAAMTAHVRQVRAHVAQLSAKEYWSALEQAPDFVVMFVPGEAFYSAAIERAPGLFEEAIANRVLIASPTTLIALVKAVAYGWQQEKLAESAQEVASLGRELYERIRTYGGHMTALGRALGQSVASFNKAVGSLEGRVLPQARKFEELGVVPTPEDLAPPPTVETEPRVLTAPDFEGADDTEAPRRLTVNDA
ncbi:MAG: DNA recombination protein RmuC [Pseudomonadota bacterium]